MSPSLQRNVASPEGRYGVLVLYASQSSNLSTCCLNCGFAQQACAHTVYNLKTQFPCIQSYTVSILNSNSQMK